MVRTARVLLLVGLALASAACRDRQDVAENVVEVSFADRKVELEVSSCGFDDDEGVIVLAASSADLFLQLLLVVTGEGDDREVDLGGSGLTLEVAREGVLGAGDASLIDTPAGTAGTIESATVLGDRFDVVADARALPSVVGDDLGGAEVALAGRCSELDEVAAALT